jgi:hypothetical protein
VPKSIPIAGILLEELISLQIYLVICGSILNGQKKVEKKFLYRFFLKAAHRVAI